MSSVTADPPTSTSTDRLSLESIPTVDLRLLSQSELTALSRCSSKAFDLSRCDDVVIPKIDRSVFNESAGSRKQTYSRLRLAPRKPDISSLKTRPATPGPHVIDDPERAENARIITLFKKLFNLDSHGGDLVPINVQCSETMPGVSNVALPNYVGGGSGEIVMKKKRGRKPMSEKLASVAIASSSQLAVVVAESVNTVPVVNDNTEAIEKEIVNKNGVALDLVELAKVDDPYGAEIRRRTNGLVKDEELLGFLSNLSGQWVSRRKKRKIVDANEFGDALPKEWKVMIGMKRKQGNAWLFCRRYISPSGRHFASCNEVSAYLLSLNGLQSTDQPNSIQCIGDSNMENRVAAANAENTPSFDNPLSSHIYQDNDHQKQPSLSNDADTGKAQCAASFKCHKCSTAFYEKDGLLHHLISCHKRKRRKSGMPIEDDCLVTKDGRYECQFCDKTFHERPSYFGHVGIHVKNYVRSMGGSPGVPTNQMRFGVVSTDRATPTASEGLEPMQVDGESITATPVATAHNEHNIGQHQVDSESVAVTPVAMAPIEHDVGRHQVDSESVAAIPVATSHNEHNFGHHQCDMLSHSDTTNQLDDNKLNILSPNVEENMKGVGSAKALSEDFSKNGDEITAIDHKLRKVEEASDISVARHNTYSSIDKMELDDENTENWEAPIETCLAGKTDTEIDESIVRQVANADSRSVTGDGHTCLGNDDDRLPSNMIAGPKEQTVSGTDVLAGHDTKLPSDNEFEDGLLRKKMGEISTRDRVEFRNGIDLLFGSGSEHLGSDVDVDNSLQHKSSESSSAASLQEKETYDNGDNINEAGESTLVSSKLEGGKEPSSSAPSMDTQTCSINDYVERASNGTTNDAAFKTCSLKKNLLSLDADSSCPKDIIFENGVCTLSENKENNYIVTHAKVESGDKLLESSREGAAKDSPLPFCTAQFEQDAVIENNVSEALPGEIEEPGSSKIMNSGNSFFDSGNSDTDVNATVANCNGPDKATACFLPVSSGNRGLLAGESDLFLSYNSFLPPKHGVTRNISSSTSFVEHRLGLTSEMHDANDHMSQSSAATSAMQLPEQQHKMESSRTDMVPYFASDMASMSTDVAPSVRQVTVSEASPFSLWNDQSFAFEDNQKSVFDGTRVEARQERASASNSLPLDSFEQTCDMGYNLNEAYVGTVQGFPRLDEPTRNTELMIGYRSNHEQPNQDVGTDALWRSNEGNVLPGGLGDASSRGQLAGSFQAFDFLSDKGGNDMYSIDDKFDNMSSFDGLRSAAVEPMEFSFLTPQHSNAQLQDPKVLSYGNAGGIPGFDSSIWLEKGSSLSNMATGPVARTTMCVWCGSEFQQEPFGYETEAGSIGSLCPTCKARISGQFL